MLGDFIHMWKLKKQSKRMDNVHVNKFPAVDHRIDATKCWVADGKGSK